MTKADTPLEWSGLVSVVKPYLDEIFAAGATESAADLNQSPFDQLNEQAREYADRRGAELVGMRYDESGELVPNPNSRWSITENTREDLQRLESKAFDEGWSPDQLAERVTDLIDDSDRARRIADTDLAKAQQAGSIAEWRQSGVVAGKSWLIGNEHNLADECDDNEAEGVIGIDEVFSSGDDTAPAHPECDCDVAAEIGEPE